MRNADICCRRFERFFLISENLAAIFAGVFEFLFLLKSVGVAFVGGYHLRAAAIRTADLFIFLAHVLPPGFFEKIYLPGSASFPSKNIIAQKIIFRQNKKAPGTMRGGLKRSVGCKNYSQNGAKQVFG